uniref:Otopetrin n=1 Tax=Anopheles dirus TaxID=7168 RepID=A0A182N028_9DIPT
MPGAGAAAVSVHPPPPDDAQLLRAKPLHRDSDASHSQGSTVASARPSPLQSRRGTLDSVELVERYHYAKNPNRSGGSHSPSLYESRRRLSSFGAQKRVFLDLIRKQGSRLSFSRKWSEASTKTEDLTREHRQLQRDRAVAWNHLGTALSALYAKLLIILGVTLPVTELVATGAPANFHQPFYLYLYGVSILFCTFLYAARYRRRAQLEFLSECPPGKFAGQLTSPGQAERKAGPRGGKVAAHSGSFYLRIGAMAFGIGSLVYSALDFGQYFELSADGGCRSVLVALMPAARMLLCLVQMQFIIVSGKDFGLDRHTLLSRFGLMHMLATNVCEWLYVLVEEAKHEIVHIRHADAGNASAGSKLADGGPTVAAAALPTACRNSTIMSGLVHKAAPFLFPCTIEYSLICALTLYELWRALNRACDPSRRQAPPADRSLTGKPANRLSIDCSSAQRGLFAGIVTLVFTFLVLIMYFVLRKEQGASLQRAATLEIVVYETVLYAATLVGVVGAMVRMRDLRVYTHRAGRGLTAAPPLPLDCHLLLVTQTGIYIYGVFSIIGTYHTHGQLLHWAVLAEVLALAQTSLQTLFVVSCWWRRCKGARQNRTKPGREIITFLLVANLAAWMVNSLVKSSASFRPLVMGFYGAGAWAIIAHISMPLAIFYRFHSTICLFEIWKNTPQPDASKSPHINQSSPAGPLQIKPLPFFGPNMSSGGGAVGKLHKKNSVSFSEQLESELASLGGLASTTATLDEEADDPADPADDAQPGSVAAKDSAPFLAVPRSDAGQQQQDVDAQLLGTGRQKPATKAMPTGKYGGHHHHHHHGGSGTMLDQIPEVLESRRDRRRSSVAVPADGHGGSNGHAKPSLMAAIRRGSLAWLPGRRHQPHDLESNMGSKVSLSQLPPSSGPLSEQALESRRKNRRFGDDALSTALSALYAKIIVILGIALPVTEILSSQIPANVYQGFYLFLYTVSIAFVIFVYASTMRRRAVLTLIKSYHEKTNSGAGPRKRIPHFGSFYLRVGAIAFGIGTMVYSGLEFGQYFELNASPGCSSIFIALTPAARMLLSLVQMQFIFLNTSELDMARHKVFARFGLMHMVATNLCEWLYVLVEETKHEIHHLAHAAHHRDPSASPHAVAGTPAVTSTARTTTPAELPPEDGALDALLNHTLVRRAAAEPAEYVDCQRTNIMGSLVQNVSPFLFPCTIEYSLICAVILYEMWKKVKTIAEIDRTRRSSIRVQHHTAGGPKSAHHFSVDCSRAHRGMFGGILLTVLTIICLIMYFVLYDEPGYEYFAIQEVTIAETLMYALTAVAVVVAMLKMRDLKYQRKKNDPHSGSIGLDCTLLVLAQTGVYVYGMFSIVGSYFAMRQGVPGAREGLVAELFSLFQTSIQTLFILNAVWRKCRGAQQNRTKPGREIVTFLLVANMAMWFINTLIKGRASFRPSHLDFFGTWAWTVITHVSMPLAIFYRFHSTICLFEVWKSTYKVKISDHH